METKEQDGIMSPEQLRLEDHFKLLEAEMDMAEQEFREEEEKWQRQIEEVKIQANHRTPRGTIDDSTTLSEDSSMEEDIQAAENVAVTMKKEMEAEEDQMLSFVEQQHAPADMSPLAAEGDSSSTEDMSSPSMATEKKKNDVSRLTSMFEQTLTPTNLPGPPPVKFSRRSYAASFLWSPSATTASTEESKASKTTVNYLRSSSTSCAAASIAKREVDDTNGSTSLSIKESKAMFERAFSPTRKIDSTTTSSVQAKAKTRPSVASQGAQSVESVQESTAAPNPSPTELPRPPATQLSTPSPALPSIQVSSVAPSPAEERKSSISTTGLKRARNINANAVIAKKKVGSNDCVSLSIKEGKAMFEKAFSSSSKPDSSIIRPKVQVEAIPMMASPSTQEGVQSKDAKDETDEAYATMQVSIISEPQLKPAHLPEPPTTASTPIRPSSTISASIEDSIESTTSSNGDGSIANMQMVDNDCTSLSIKEGTSMFERPFSPGSKINSNIRSKVQAKAKPTIASPSSRGVYGNEEANVPESMFEPKLKPDNLPESPTTNISTPSVTSSVISVSTRQPRQSSTARKDMGGNSCESLSIKEGKAMFERALSPSNNRKTNNKAGGMTQPILARTNTQDGNNNVVGSDLRKTIASVCRGDASADITARPSPYLKDGTPIINEVAGPVDSISSSIAVDKSHQPESKPGRIDHPPSSLKERISMMESSNSTKPSLPTLYKMAPAALEIKQGPRHLCPTPEPDSLNIPSSNMKERDSSSRLRSNEKVAVPFTPIRSTKTLTLPENIEKNIASMCSSDTIQQRRILLMQGLQRHLNNKNKSPEKGVSSDNADKVVKVVNVSPRGMFAYSTDRNISPSPIRPNVKHGTTYAPLQPSYLQQSAQHGVRSSLPASSTFHNANQARIELNDGNSIRHQDTQNKNTRAVDYASKTEHDPEDGLFGDGIMLPHECTKGAPAKKITSKLYGSTIFGMCTKCITILVNKLDTFAKRAKTFFKPCCALMRSYFGALVIFCWVNMIYLVEITRKKVNEVVLSILHHFKRCINEHRRIMTLAPQAAQTIASWTATMERGIALCFVSLTLSIAVEMYPTVPSHNSLVSILLVFFRLKTEPDDWKDISQYHSILIITTVVFSICIDVDWLSFKYFPKSLNGEELSFRLEQDTSMLWIITWYGVLFNLVLKLICLNDSLKRSHHGRNLQSILWKRFGKCFISRRTPEDLNVAVNDKVIAQAWIEIICSLLCLSYFFAIKFDIVSSSLFREATNQILSLDGALLLKGASGFFVFLSLAHHIHIRDMLGLFSCSSICPILSESHSTSNRGRRTILSRMEESCKCIIFVKVLDFIMAIILWVSLVSVHTHTGFDAPKNITTLLGLIFTTQMFTSIISPILGAVVFWYVRISTQQDQTIDRHERTRLADKSPVSRSRENDRTKRSSTPSTTKKSNQTCSKSENGYDLSYPSNSQSLFQARLSGASNDKIAIPKAPSSLLKSNELDVDVICSPRQFQAEWKNLERGLLLSHKIHHVPILSDCHKHFHVRRFYVVGSGMIGETLKMFLIAQRRAKPPANKHPLPSLKKSLTRCLIEIAFNSNSHEMSAEIRCCSQHEVRFFLSVLDLKELSSIQNSRI